MDTTMEMAGVTAAIAASRKIPLVREADLPIVIMNG
jgi:hypothetical protein